MEDQAQWSARYLGVFAAGFAAITLIVGLVQPFWLRMTVSGVVWAVLVVGGHRGALRGGVVGRVAGPVRAGGLLDAGRGDRRVAARGGGVAGAVSVSAARHPRHGLEDLLTNGVRLSITAALDGVDRAEFALIRDAVEITDSALSKQAAVLEAAGYLGVDKGRVGCRPRTWLRLTTTGRQALTRHLRALEDIAHSTHRPADALHESARS